MVSIFGYRFVKDDKDAKLEKDKSKSFALPANEDGSVVVQGGGVYGTYVDIEGSVKNDQDLIARYRDMSMQPECEKAIDDIVNEAIVMDEFKPSVSVVLSKPDRIPEKIQTAIKTEFETIMRLLDFNSMGADIFRRWYIDGKLYYHKIIDKEAPNKGIINLRYIDPRLMRKVREIKRERTGKANVDITEIVDEYFIYSERGMIGQNANMGVKISKDSIAYVHSGLYDPRRNIVLSYMHKAIKPVNQLRMVEDALVIYRLARAPERRIFYIDVGNLPRVKAEQYLRDMMTKYRNKLVYDANTGEIRDDRKFMSMLEDYWLPRREGGKGTEISTLPGGDNLGQIQDIEYFEQRLFKSLNIPITRLQSDNGFNLGKSSEITRDELMFTKFIQKLRRRFSQLFDDILKTQLILKNVISESDWELLKDNIFYDFLKDSYFSELKDSEILSNRLQLVQLMDPYVGRYFDREYIRKNILRQTDEEIKKIDKGIEADRDEDMELQKKYPGIMLPGSAFNSEAGMPQTMAPQEPEQAPGGYYPGFDDQPQQNPQQQNGGQQPQQQKQQPKPQGMQ